MKKVLFIIMMLMPMLAWADNITFADENVKAICVANWDTDGDGELSKAEAAAVTTIGEAFMFNEDIVSFDELRYFTGLTDISFWCCHNLQSITIPENITNIGPVRFGYCSSLSTITILNPNFCFVSSDAFKGCDIKKAYLNGIIGISPSRLFPNADIVYGERGGYAYSGLGCEDDYLNTYESPLNKDYLDATNWQLKFPIEICTNNVEISQIQFDIHLGSGFSIATDENGKGMVEMDKERFDYDPDFGYSHNVTLTQFDDSHYRVVITNYDNTPIKGTEGNALYVTLKVSENVKEGDYDNSSPEYRDFLTVDSVEFSTPSADRLPSEGFRKAIKVYLRDSGNFNGDEAVSVTDYAGVVKWVAGQGYDDQGVPEWVIKKASDVNEDGEITVTDVSGIVNIVLYGNYKGKTTNAKAHRAAKASGAVLNIEPFSINRGETKEIAVNLSSAYTDLSQCQFDLVLPEGLSVASADERLAIYPGDITRSADGYNHSVASALREDGTVRVLCLSSSNEAFNDAEGGIVRMKLVADKDMTVGENAIELANVEFAKTDASQLIGMGGFTTIAVGEPTGISSIGGQSAMPEANFSADGIRRDRLSKGLNIVRYADGSIRKVMVK